MLLLRKRCAIPTSTYRQQEFTVSNRFISTCHNTGTRGVTPKLTPSAVPAFEETLEKNMVLAKHATIPQITF